MILLFTDFGYQGPYIGQMHAALKQAAPDIAVIDLMHDAARFNPGASAYLLAALAPRMPEKAICVAVVDPGVGTQRRPLALKAGQRWFVGPDNGLFNVLPHVLGHGQCFEITWQPPDLSKSFHGRDLFAPVAAALARGEADGYLTPVASLVPAAAESAEVIYVDGFGNAMTGLRASTLNPAARLQAGRQTFIPADTFGDRPPGTRLWYANSSGLAELSICQGSAANACGLNIGEPVYIL